MMIQYDNEYHMMMMSMSFTQVIFKEDGQLIETRLQQVFQVCML